MDYIEKSQLIDEKSLDQKYYFQSLFQLLCEKKLLSEERIKTIQLELVDLMGKEITRYTNDESSSVKIEIAQQILQSITYSIGFFLKTTIDVTQKLDILRSDKISELYYQGRKAVINLTKEAEVLLQDLKNNSPKLKHYAYQDTIFTALPEFFHDYDIEFGAHEIPASIDYQLYDYQDVLLGVEYIYDYLTRMLQEDLFLRCFPTDRINHLLISFDQEAEHLLVNIFELVLNNAIGCILLGKSSSDLYIQEKELKELQISLGSLTKEQRNKKLKEAYDELLVEIAPESGTAEYLKTAIERLADRLTYHLLTGTLDKLFLPTDHMHQVYYYEDGISMEDEKLRELIEKLTRCKTTEDKILLMKECVHSTADFMELMEQSFYEEEYEQVLTSFSDSEIAVLQKSVRYHYGAERLDDFEPLSKWQQLLFHRI